MNITEIEVQHTRLGELYKNHIRKLVFSAKPTRTIGGGLDHTMKGGTRYVAQQGRHAY